MPRKKITQEIAVETALIENKTEGTDAEKIRANLEKIKSNQEVVGYIFRNTTSAAIDLKDPSKIIDYAIVSSSALDAAEKLSELFNIGTANHIIIQGKDVKMLSLSMGENKLSVFLEKNADHQKILKKLKI